MHLQTYLLYLTALAAGMLTPGPAMLQALTLGLRFGPRPVVLVACGNVCSSVVQVAAALFGLSLLAGQPGLLRGAGLLGAAYLGWLGLKLWMASGRPDPDAAPETGPATPPSRAALFGQGALVAFTNPKAWGFLAAMLPPFAAAGRPEAATVALLAWPIAVLAFGGMLAYACFGAWLTRTLASPQRMRWIFRLFAATLWWCAAGLAME